MLQTDAATLKQNMLLLKAPLSALQCRAALRRASAGARRGTPRTWGGPAGAQVGGRGPTRLPVNPVRSTLHGSAHLPHTTDIRGRRPQDAILVDGEPPNTPSDELRAMAEQRARDGVARPQQLDIQPPPVDSMVMDPVNDGNVSRAPPRA